MSSTRHEKNGREMVMTLIAVITIAIITTAAAGLSNQPPIADSKGPYNGTEGVAIPFNGTASYDPDGSIVSFGWGFGFGDGNTGTGESPAYTYAQDGTYNVTLVVTDNEGATDTKTTTATIADTKPTADFAGTATSGLKPLTVNFADSSTSYDAITAWEWDFGDGYTSTEQNPTHVYTTEGSYTVSLTGYEADGDSDTATKLDYIIVTRENQLPVSVPNGPYTGTEGVAILFCGSGSYDPDGSIISFAWDFGFGDGNTGTGESPAHTYEQDGIYTVSLVVTDNEDATDTKTTTATIDDIEPTASFAGTPTSGLKPLTVDFADSSTSYDAITAWDWDFGDGNTSSEQNLTHMYTTEGCYTVSLTVYEADGNSDTEAKVDYIIVTQENQPPVSDAMGPYTGTEGVAILFCGSGSYDPDGSIISFAWDFGFGDGNNCTSTGLNTTYTYAQNGTYNVTLVVTDSEGATDTKTTTATIADTEPTADFSATTTSGPKPLTVDFADSSTTYDGIAAWEWDFGDGNTSTEQNLTHEYATEGSYTVSLTVYEADGDSDTEPKVDYIIVTRENQSPVSDAMGPYMGTEGAAILFCGSGSYDPDGGIISFAWDFGFGDGNTGTGESPAYTYAQDGTYNVTFLVTDNEGATDTSTTTATIADTEPTADFAGTPTSGLKPLTVDFADSTTSYDGITTREWDFGDGYTSTEQNPTHVYTTEGSYTVSLTVYEADGDSDTKAKVDYINVTRENQPPISDLNGHYTGTEGAAILFSGSGSYDPDGSIISYVWDFGFGDGNTGAGESPAHTYAQNGTYTVTLVVADNEGATDTNTTTATIADTEPTADFAGTPTSGLKPLTVDFSDSSTSYDAIAAWEWDFGDGNTSSEQNPTHMYTTEGIYTASLTVYEADGDSDTEAKVDYIIVTRENQPPISYPNGPYTGTEGVAILFSGSGSYDPDGSIISYGWDFGFGDGNTGTGESPAYTYAQNGTYNVTLVVTDNEGATDTKTTTATIADTEPTADFSATPASGLKPLTVNFSDSSTTYDGITAWDWDFGDGNTSSEQNLTHMYTTEGCYTVSLTVYEADGNSDTEAKVDYIIVTQENQPPVSDPNGPYTGTEGAAILFSGSGSYDPDGSIISYAWDFGFGDGNNCTSTEMNTAYTYAQNGIYNVTLVVTDSEGATDTSNTTATIDYTEPIANLSFELNPSGINFGAVEIGIEKIVFTTITNTGNCPAKVTVTKCIMKGKTRGDTIPVSALGVNGNYVDNPVIVSSSLGCKESVTVKFAIQVPVGTLADTYNEGFTITVCQP